MKNVYRAFLFFLTVCISGFSSGGTVQVTGNPTYYVVNNTGSCFTLTYVTNESDTGGYCGTNPCLENLSESLPPGVTQSVVLPGSGDYIVLSYSVFSGAGTCDQATCNPSSTSDCSYYCGSCNGDYTSEFSITIPYEGGTGSNFSFSASGNPLPTVTYNAGTQTYTIE
jgi:hypothetical protein